MSIHKPDHVDNSKDKTALDADRSIMENINGLKSEIQQQLEALLSSPEQIDNLAKSVEVTMYIQGLQKICKNPSTPQEHSATILLLQQLQTLLSDLDVQQYSSLFIVQADEKNFLDFTATINQIELLTRVAKKVGGISAELIQSWIQQLKGKRVEKENGQQFCQKIIALVDAAHCFLLYEKEKVRLCSRTKKDYSSAQFRCLRAEKNQKPAIESTQFPLLHISNIDVE